MLIVAKFASAVNQSKFGNGFALLPPSSDWNELLKDMSASDIEETVKIYMEPFKQFQRASRDLKIRPKQLKLSLVTAISLLHESVKNFSIASEEFTDAKGDIDSFLVLSNAAFSLKKIKDLEPVFDVDSLAAFSRQRLKHLIGTKQTSYISFLMKRNSYQNLLNEWNIVASRYPKCEFRGLFARNLDLAYIEHMTALYLNIMRIRGKGDAIKKMPHILKFIRKMRRNTMIHKIKALGNGYSTSNPPYSGFLIVVCTFYALLFTILF